MYAKVFTQIFDSSIADNWKTRHVFEDLLKLSDVNGVVDMTHEAIAARTRMPLEMIRDAIAELEAPDTRSRTPEADGRRIERLDDHRDWGWHIVNHQKFRLISSEDQRREKTRLRVASFKLKRKQLQTSNASVTRGNASVTLANAQIHKQKQRADSRSKEQKKQLQRVNARTAQTPSAGEEVVAAWNEMAKASGLPRTLKMTDKRWRYLKARLRDDFFVANWREALKRVGVSPFCKGEEGDRGWIANLDWFLQPDSVVKTIEGKYDTRIVKGQRPPPRPGEGKLQGGAAYVARLKIVGNES